MTACGGLPGVPTPRLQSTPAAPWPLPLAARSQWLPNPRPRGGPHSLHQAPAPRSLAAADSLQLPAPSRLPSSREGRRPEPGSSLAVVGPPPLRSAPPLSLAKSLKAQSPFVTPGASNHSVSISLTLFILLKTHLKTLQPGVCSGLYPH